MAVVQISRIQIRRGQKNQGSGLPQLASGELGWAIDTRELFIGNGSISEGSPEVGNTKILTQYDDLFSLAETYSYKENLGYIQTGISNISPVVRTLQDRLDDRVSGRAFGLTGDPGQNATVRLQQAIDQLFLNVDKNQVKSRVTLELEPGVYAIDATIYIPPSASIVGAGNGKTIIRQTADFPIFQTVNGTSTPNSPADISTSDIVNQPQNIKIANLTLENDFSNKALICDCCKDSIFDNIHFKGPWTMGDVIPASYAAGIGVEINNYGGSVISSNLKFTQCIWSGWYFGIMSNWDTLKLSFNQCDFIDLGYGITFGPDMLLNADPTLGKSRGPSVCSIRNCNFENIARHAIWIDKGKYNTIESNYFKEVGNEGGAENDPAYSVCNILTPTNQLTNNLFNRTTELGTNSDNFESPYLPEVDGLADYQVEYNNVITFTQTGSIFGSTIFRLPSIVNQTYVIDYQMVGTGVEFHRVGQLQITIDSLNTDSISIVDDYDYIGNGQYEDAVSFLGTFHDYDGDANAETVKINVVSTTPSNATVSFKYTLKHKRSNFA